ncbi:MULTISPECIES: protein-L-isoaspartate(D-aspartate) O-methyltransferase [unclassified Halorubrum]|uniref:protein-L-isoaspartate(D-aspartate) O-methyltransferase n=1 Tax=unclassified Halorubrum TaxID=2642239 RepID=UPI000B9941CA|nr:MULTISPECIES: protein-L-isoaspartate(D-aspartate) O-methyltransferase [unclassified Halorubrum]OYR39303.1 protein-L-isoaspartate O-methyltransferase [Halorubrum sp. Eb13]OYR44451.1 protein-L-isoaspartate O-methyltransferase [Halorubrum sp. Hd13]
MDNANGPEPDGGPERGGSPDLATARRELVDSLRARLDVSERTLSAVEAVPRHEFVPESHRSRAYADRPLPIGHDQTISAPHMVAMMSDLLELDRGDRVLEVGTGCGYHAAVLAELVGPGNVFSAEYVPELAAEARERLDRLGYDVTVRSGDGREAFRDAAPFDAASLTCAASGGVPDPIVEQVRTGGRIVAPVGDGGFLGRGGQRLVRLTVREDGVDREDHGGVRFVPMR